MVVRAQSGLVQPAEAAAELTWGTTIIRSFANPSSGRLLNHTFTDVTGLTGFEKAVVICQWQHNWIDRNTAIGPYTVTQNGASLTKVSPFTFNDSDSRFKYGQVAILYIDDPADGDFVFTYDTEGGFPGFTCLAATFMPVNGATAGAAAFGTPSTTLVDSTATALANSLTTTQADTSYRIAAYAGRHTGHGAFTYTDANLVKQHEDQLNSGEGDDDLSFTVARAQNGATGAYTMGGNWAGTPPTDNWSGGHSIEVLAA